MGTIAPARAVVDLTAVRVTDVDTVGGKGANLGEMIAAGFPVPGGAVVTADAYLDAMERAGVRAELARLTVDVVEAGVKSMTLPAAAAPRPVTAEEFTEQQAVRTRNVLDMLHPPSAPESGPIALDAGMAETVKIIAEQSGLDADAIAAMLKLDVAAVRAVLGQ